MTVSDKLFGFGGEEHGCLRQSIKNNILNKTIIVVKIINKTTFFINYLS